MITPQGYFTLLTKALMRLRRTGKLDAFQAFVRGPVFREQILGLAPDKIDVVLQAAQRAREACARRTPQPAKPKPWTAQTRKLNWVGNPALRARLARTYAKHGPDNHRAVAAEMHMTVGQVRLAKRRFLDAAAAVEFAQAA